MMMNNKLFIIAAVALFSTADAHSHLRQLKGLKSEKKTTFAPSAAPVAAPSDPGPIIQKSSKAGKTSKKNTKKGSKKGNTTVAPTPAPTKAPTMSPTMSPSTVPSALPTSSPSDTSTVFTTVTSTIATTGEGSNF